MSISKQAVRASFDNFVKVNTTLTKHFKDSNPALLLGYFISEEAYHESKSQLDSKGYFYCKCTKIEEKFGFSKQLQSAILKQLVQADLIEVYLKAVDGSNCISRVRHIKVYHENIYNFVKNITVPSPEETMPSHLVEIKDALISFCKRRCASWIMTKEDEKVLKIATIHGLCKEVMEDKLQERHKRLRGKRVTFKYLLKPLIPDIDKYENYVREDKPKIEFLL
jgi:hypothetical protein